MLLILIFYIAFACCEYDPFFEKKFKLIFSINNEDTHAQIFLFFILKLYNFQLIRSKNKLSSTKKMSNI